MNTFAKIVLRLAAVAAIFLVVRYFLLAPPDCSQASPQAAAEHLVAVGTNAVQKAYDAAQASDAPFTCPDAAALDIPEQDACFSRMAVTITEEPDGCRVAAGATLTESGLRASREAVWHLP